MELENSLGVDWYEMDMRQYDPAIARWTAIDPVTHWSNSTYNAFDNNPVYWADPSGADSWSYVGNGMYQSNTGEVTTDYQRAIDETNSHVESGGCTDPPCKKPSKDQDGETKGNFFTRLMGALMGYLHLSTPDYQGDNLTEAQAAIIEKRKKEKQEVQMAIAEQTLEITQGSLEYGSYMPMGPGGAVGVVSLFKNAFKNLIKWFGKKAVKEGVNVSAKKMVFTVAEKEALKIATGYSRTKIVNGQGIITQFGIYQKTSATQIRLIKEGFKRNGATSIKIYTNSPNEVMKDLITPRMKSGKGIFGLSIKKRKLGGYILEGKL